MDLLTMHEKLESAVADAKNVLDSLGIEYGPVSTVTVNFVAKSFYGRCTHRMPADDYVIEISSLVLANNVEYDRLMDIVLHEFLHAHKDRMCHTGEWKRCANLINKTYPRYHVERTSSAAIVGVDRSVVGYKYKITCNTCGQESFLCRKTKLVKALMRQPNGSCVCQCCNGESFTLEVLR